MAPTLSKKIICLNTASSSQNPGTQRDPVRLALENEMILRQICSFSSFATLTAIRQLNLLSNQIATTFVREKVLPFDFAEVFYSHMEKTPFPNSAKSGTNVRLWTEHLSKEHRRKMLLSYLQMLTNLIESSKNFPSTSFTLLTGLLNTASDNVIFQRFLKTASPIVTKLTVNNPMGLPLFYQSPSDKTFNLQYLQLKTLQLGYYGPGSAKIETCPWKSDFTLYGHLIQCAPQLETLEINNCLSSALITGIFNVLDDKSLQKIKHLNLRGTIENQHIERLFSSGVQLASLSLQFQFKCSVPQQALNVFLQSQAATLENLHIVHNALDHNADITVPCIKKLKALEIYSQSETVTFPGLLSKNKYPALTELKLDLSLEQISSIFISGMQPLETVVSLGLPLNLKDSEVIIRAAKIFPNVRKLKIAPKKHLLETVQTSMGGNVQELILAGENLDDFCNVLTGYSLEAITKFEKLRRQCMDGAKNVVAIVKSEQKGPIAFLDKIRVLRIQTKFWMDLVLVLGPYRLASLKCLDLRRSDIFPQKVSSKVHKPVLDMLRKKFLVRVHKDQICHQQPCDKSFLCKTSEI